VPLVFENDPLLLVIEVPLEDMILYISNVSSYCYDDVLNVDDR
jgi:hypothetical protein